MHEASLSQSDVDKFMKTEYVSALSKGRKDTELQQASANPPSFSSGATLNNRLESLPDIRMPWMATIIKPRLGTLLANDRDPHKDGVTLYHRDPLAAIQSLLDRPALQDHLEWAPQHVWTDETCTERVYSKIMMGNWAWETQVCSSFLIESGEKTNNP